MLPSQIDHHIVAAISIAGSGLDVLGSLYLAYDLLGGREGPLRLLTRSVTYSIVFGVGYGLGLGLIFGLAAGVALGVTSSVEINRIARGRGHFPLYWEALFSVIRAAGIGVGLYPRLGARFAIAFAFLVTCGQIVAYSRGIHPGMDYSNAPRARFTSRQFWSTLVRTVGYTGAALLCSALVTHVEHAWLFAIRVGLVTGVVTGIGQAVNPLIEHFADNLPERRLGAFGIALILCGFTLQSVQYWLALLDIRLS